MTRAKKKSCHQFNIRFLTELEELTKILQIKNRRINILQIIVEKLNYKICDST